MNRTIASLLAGTALALTATAALADDYPERPVQVIVPYSAGGGTDLSARVMADVFERLYPDATMVVRNQPGGGGSIGTSAALHARPDGYTLGTGSQGPLAILPHLGGTDYTLDDVTFIGLMGRNLQIAVACADAPFATVDEFFAYAREHPGELQVGNTGAGGANHISMAALGQAADVDFEHVPFNGASEAVTACLGGHIDAMTMSPAEALPHAQSGNVTPLFVMEEERIADYPDTPTLVESGIDFTWASWKGIIAPKDTPEDVVAWLRDAFAAVFTDEEFVSRMTEMGEFVDYRDAAGYEALVRHDSEVAEQVLRDLGMYGMNR